jgi:PAS domain-containing protein
MTGKRTGRRADGGTVTGKAGRPTGLSPLERILLCLLDTDGFDRGLPAFLHELTGIVEFDWAALSAPPGYGPRAFRRPEPGERFLDAALPAGFALPVCPRDSQPTEVEDPFLLATLRDAGVERAYQVPLPFDDGGGTLLLGRSRDEPFAGDGLDVATAVWPALATAVHHAAREGRSEIVYRERSTELSALFDVVRTAGRAIDFEDLFVGLCSAIQPLMGVDQIAVLLDLEGRRSLTFYLARPLSDRLEEELVARCVEEFRRESGRNTAPSTVRRRALAGFDPNDAEATRTPEIFEAAPLKRRGRSAGLMVVVAERGRVRESMSRMLAATAGQASLTVDRLQAGAEAQARRLSAVIDSMSDGVILTDSNFRVEILNPAASDHLLALTGERRPEILGDLGGMSLAEMAEEVVSGTRDSVKVEVRVSEPRRILNLTVTTLARGRGVAGGLVIVTSDVTEARALQEQMIQTEKLSALGEMISGVAHELNNPLASVMGYAQLLQSSRVRPEVKRRLETIASEAQRCQTIVRNLLSFARKHRPERRALSVNEAVRAPSSTAHCRL